MPPIYDHRMTQATIATLATLERLIQGNANRVSLMFSCDDATGNYAFAFGESFSNVFMVLSGPFSQVMTYRDFGPLIREPLFVSLGVQPRTIRVLEVLLVPGTM